MSDLPHLNEAGEAHMIDVGDKPATRRTAVAEAIVSMGPDTVAAFFGGDLAKGDAAAVVRLGAIMGAKRTSDLVPLCHPLALSSVEVTIEPHESGVRIEVTAAAVGPTGVEMEAMTGAALGAIALYDMVKSRERGVAIGPVQLLSKSGGRSGTWQR